jgi:hypothetical protein
MRQLFSKFKKPETNVNIICVWAFICLHLSYGFAEIELNAMLEGGRELPEPASPQTARNIYDVGRKSGFSFEFLYKVYLVTLVDTRYGCGRCIVYICEFVW